MRYVIILLSLVYFSSSAQSVLKESVKMKSAVLGKEVEYSIYLPTEYDKSERRYPVLFLLHGFSDDETGWTQFGEVKFIADQEIEAGRLTPTIIVMPDAGVSWYINSPDGKTKYEDFFIKEFIPFVDAQYRTRGTKQYRAVSGLSMGGFGSAFYAIKYPELFSVCAPLSAAVLTDDEVVQLSEDRWKNVYGLPYGRDLQGNNRLTTHLKANSIFTLVEQTPADKLSTVFFYFDCGDDDHLIGGNMALNALLLRKKIPHEFRVRNGGHTWTYWRTALPDVFRVITEAFHR